MKYILLMICLAFLPSLLCAQKADTSFDCLIRIAEGDLNQDGLSDKATIKMDTVDQRRPLKLQVFLAKSAGDYEEVFASPHVIEAMYPAGDSVHNGSQIPDVYIKEGALQIDFYINGNSSYLFRWNDNSFELIHFRYVNYDGIHIVETEFDLLTCMYKKQVELFATATIIEDVKRKIMIRPLPRLKGFKPFENELY